MRIITPSVEIMRTGLETEIILPEQFIEKVGRTCYKSEDKITEDSAAKFVGNLIKRGHEAMIEHWNLVFKTDFATYDNMLNDWDSLMHNANIYEENRRLGERLRPYIRFTEYLIGSCGYRHIISGNMRAWRDYARACVNTFGYIPNYMHGMIRNYPLFFPEFQDYVPAVISNTFLIPIDISELSDSERQVHQNVTVKFICDRGVSHEIVRHRVASFAQESTRYCNYGQDKFGSEITVIEPSWCELGDDRYDNWRAGCMQAEAAYFTMLADGSTPQEARSVLPNSLKTEIIVTMNLDGWDHFFSLRDDAAAHPDMRHIAHMARELFDIFVYEEEDYES